MICKDPWSEYRVLLKTDVGWPFVWKRFDWETNCPIRRSIGGARCLGAQRCQHSATSSGEQHSYFDTASHFARVTVRVYLFKSSEHE